MGVRGEAAPFYSRDGLNVEVYDRLTESVPDFMADIPFLISQAAEAAGPVLELASGTGRVIWPLAEAGHEVVGLDLNPPMIRRAEEKGQLHPETVRRRVRFHQGDMRSFDLGQSFGLVYSTFRSFQVLLTPEEQRQALGCVRGHLRSGGRLILDIFDPLLDWCVPEGCKAKLHRVSCRHPESGNRVNIEVRTRSNDAVRQILSEVWRFREVDAKGKVLREEHETLVLRWSYRYEMRHLFELAGFRVIAEYSDFLKSPPAYGREQVWVVEKS